MSYIESTLVKGEEVIYEGKLSVWSLLPIVVVGILLLPFYGAGLILLVVAYLRYISTELALTNKRIIAKVGFITRNTIEINLSKVESIRISQGLFGRLMNFGGIIVSGSGASHAPILGINNPLEFRKHVLEKTEVEKV